MAVKFKPITGRVSALALAIAALALPLTAQAQDEGRRFRDNEAAGNIGGDNEARHAPRSAPREDNGGGWSRPAQAAPQAHAGTVGSGSGRPNLAIDSGTTSCGPGSVAISGSRPAVT